MQYVIQYYTCACLSALSKGMEENRESYASSSFVLTIGRRRLYYLEMSLTGKSGAVHFSK